MKHVHPFSSFLPSDHQAGLLLTFQRNNVTNEYIHLIIAGGGGGKSMLRGDNPIQADGGLSASGSGLSSETYFNGPGMCSVSVLIIRCCVWSFQASDK